MLRSLREPRYAALAALMFLVALVCIGAGSWQISRFVWKEDANGALRTNFHAASAPVDDVLVLHGATPPAADSYKYRTITATGTYDAAHQVLVRNESINAPQSDTDSGGSENGYFVLTPLHTSTATLLVARGFIAVSDSSAAPEITAPPSGTVSVRARAMPADTTNDHAGELRGQVNSINVAQQQARLGGTFYDGYAELLADQPGTQGLTVIPGPSLSNPAGGAIEPQHFAYVIQWYLFAALAIAAPFVMIRAERHYKKQDALDEFA